MKQGYQGQFSARRHSLQANRNIVRKIAWLIQSHAITRFNECLECCEDGVLHFCCGDRLSAKCNITGACRFLRRFRWLFQCGLPIHRAQMNSGVLLLRRESERAWIGQVFTRNVWGCAACWLVERKVCRSGCC